MIDTTYKAVGRAIKYSQIFELSFTIFMEFHRMVTEVEYREKSEGRISENVFKTPTKNHVRKLLSKNLINNELSIRLDTLIENRHKLVHRWIHEENWPADDDSEGCIKLIKHAHGVETESREITTLLAKYLLENASREQAGDDYEKYVDDVKHMFVRASEGF